MVSPYSKKTIISNRNISTATYLISLLQYRKVIYMLVYRDFKTKYTQTRLGWLWPFLQPLITLAVYTFFFSKLIKIDTGDIPYPLIALSGIIIWSYFSSVIGTSSIVLVSSQAIIKNIRFPKVCLIIAKSILSFFDTIISLLIIFVSLVIIGVPISYHVIFIPFILFFTWMISFTLSIWIAAFSLKRRDILNTVPHLLTIGIWLTPVFYPSTIIPSHLEFLGYLNPIAGLIEALRFCLLYTKPPSVLYLIGLGLGIVFFILGIKHFKNIEKDIAEFI